MGGIPRLVRLDKPGGTDNMSALPVHHRKNVGRGEYGADDLPALLNALVGLPARNRAYAGVFAVGVYVLRIRLSKGTEDGAFCV